MMSFTSAARSGGGGIRGGLYLGGGGGVSGGLYLGGGD